MQAINAPWIEGEKIPEEQIEDIFRQPPGVTLPFYRSSLVIGSRGVGKTTLFRYQKALHDKNGIAIHVSLATELASLTKQTGLGPLAFDIPENLEPFVIGKATSLLAVSLAERLLKRGVTISQDSLAACLPMRLASTNKAVDANYLTQTKRLIARGSPEVFEGISETQPLPDFVSSLGEASLKTHGPLLLLLDRADMVIAPSIVPVLQLLDQSSQYIALVAMRPGPVGQAVVNVSSVPGDHYSVVHLGISPRSPEWAEFVEGAVQAQIGQNFSSIPRNIKSGIIAISRDSLRTSLELFARYLSVPRHAGQGELLAALEDLRENQLAAAQRTLQKYHPNFRKMVAEFRNEAIGTHGQIKGPLVLCIKHRPRNNLFDTPKKLNRFIEEGLRSGAFCMPEDNRWTPGLHPTELEIPQLLIWQRGDLLWTGEPISPTKLSKNENEILSSSGGPPKTPTIFVAYRMRIEESKKFRTEIEKAIHSHHALSHLKVTDGHVPAGTQWATAIRERIKNAKAVVSDVTGMSSEVLFELGFAYGLTKTIIPVISRPSDFSDLPRWLGATQLGCYETEAGMMGILSDISTHLSDSEFNKPLRPAQPVPALAVWLRELEWNKHALEQFSTSAIKEGLRHEAYADVALDEIIIRRAASASLLIVSLDGTEADALMHYVCGAVAAKPKAGTGKSLSRVILILEEPTEQKQTFIAESLRRCQDTVRVIRLDQVREETGKFGKNYNKWAAVAPAGENKQ